MMSSTESLPTSAAAVTCTQPALDDVLCSWPALFQLETGDTRLF